MTAHFWTGEYNDVAALIEEFHYTHRVPANVQLVVSAHDDGGLFGDKGRCIAGVCFSIPPTRWGVDCWELSRLVRRDDSDIMLSSLISYACKLIKRKGLQSLLVSFADARLHHGGVYRASSWNYAGMRSPSSEGVRVDGVFMPGRTATGRFGTRSAKLLRERGVCAEDVKDQGKHLYWRSLTRKGRHDAKLCGFNRQVGQRGIDG